MKKLLPLIGLLFSVQANAGVFIEPFLGFDSTTVTATTSGGATASSTSSGMDYGARLGYRFQAFWLGAEFAGGSGKDKGTSTETDYSKSAVGVVFGYDFGRYDVWVGYGFSDKLTYKTTPELEVKGTNFKIGLGYEATNHVSLNLDLILPNYTKASAGGNEVEISDIYSKFTVTTTMLSVSFPFGDGR